MDTSHLETNTQTIERLTKDRNEARTALCREQEKLKMTDEKQVRENIAFLMRERDEALVKCAEMRDFIVTHTDMKPGLTMPQWEDYLNRRTHALSSDCGKGFMRRSELDKTIELLESLYLNAPLVDLRRFIWDEKIRLEALRKGAE